MFSSLRNFFVVFLISLLGFGILGHCIVTIAVPALISGEEESAAEESSVQSDDASGISEDSSEDAEQKQSGNAFTFAFFCTDVNDELAAIYIVHTDDGYETCTGALLPGTASLENNGAATTLKRLYLDNGRDYLLQKLRFLTGYAIDEYASLAAVDSSGMGRSIVELSTYLGYTYRISTAFTYPNPNYNGDSVTEDESADESADGAEEYIVVAAGDYALNGRTQGVSNYELLLDTEWNAGAHEIYGEMIRRLLNDASYAGNPGRQELVFDFMMNKSFASYSASNAAKYLFNDYEKGYASYTAGSGAWDELKLELKTLEKGGQS